MRRNARDREERRDEAQLDEAAARVRDHPREQEVERRAAALAEHGADQLAERAAAREEGERLVLVWRPHRQPGEEEGRRDRREPADTGAPQRVGRSGECKGTRAPGRRRCGVAHLGIIGNRPGTLLA